MPTPTLVVAEEVIDEEDVVVVDSADVVLDAEAVEDMAEIVVKEAVLEVVAEVEAVEDLEADVDAAATTATKTVILPENAPRETVVAMEDPNTKKMGLLPETSHQFFVSWCN